MWQEENIADVLNPGLHRWTGHLPLGIRAPEISTPKSISLLDRTWTLQSYQVNGSDVVLEIMTSASNEQSVSGVAIMPGEDMPGSITLNKALPLQDTGSGFSKASVIDVNTGQAVPVVAIIGVVVALLGVYLIVDKTEKLVDNPSVSIALVIAAVIALLLVWKEFKK